MDETNLADLRRDYSREELSRSSVAADPFEQFGKWMKEALQAAVIEPTAMVVSTVSSNGQPSSRTVLLKGFDHDGFVFFTNYESRKGREIAENPHVSLMFHWPDLERQILISGTAAKASRERSETYFVTRPRESQIGAWASRQSSVLSSRAELEERIQEVRTKFGEGDIACPPNWGGYCVVPHRIEFWQGRKSRLHDRLVYELEAGGWTIVRLAP